MNTPKFRAWNKELKQMFIVTSLEFNAQGELLMIDLYGYGSCTYKKSIIDLMECIHLKDRHGTDIYRNDIVKTFNVIGASTMGYVSYDQQLCCWIIANDKEEWFDILSDMLYENLGFEIIGNVYHNPELGVMK